jgi:hypothetical protein
MKEIQSFDTINESPTFHKSTSRKVYANAYLDDKTGFKTSSDLSYLLQITKAKKEDIDQRIKMDL